MGSTPRLTIACCAPEGSVAARQTARILCEQWDQPLRHGAAGADPFLAMQAWNSGILVVPGEPAEPLAPGVRWLDALAAARRPTLLAIPVGPHAAGQGAAYAALLLQAGVPLAGLVLMGPGATAPRFADRLPWLGAVNSSCLDAEALDQLRELLLVRLAALRH
ncbi:MAG: hypothetical protein ERJ67_06205 [Aphanocapsa feldmannii 277cV]|uniref:Uncharacterized protein n=2 Tax=Aphanocapsa feldmannii TaxID=192050 RepID=A0A524RN71_9CHRO|nr:MAG: hypothetical protein ERJ67_06205 [Aphanocapsa feldmannii 277cV]TGH20455.1 MAG: hypothetical protein ERJ68_06830 [Aphanocapsa feldmannii 277cI]